VSAFCCFVFMSAIMFCRYDDKNEMSLCLHHILVMVYNDSHLCRIFVILGQILPVSSLLY